MPKPEEDKKEAEKASEVIETPEGGVEVSVEEEKEAAPVEQEPKEKEKPKPEDKPDVLKNKVYAQDRIISRLQKEIDELRQKSGTAVSVQQLEPKLDDLDELAQKDWKLAVSKLSEQKFRELQAQENKRISEERHFIEEQNLMEKNSEAVLNRHPELNDPSTEKSQIFQTILNNNPRWRISPDGPLLTMYELENELRKRGYDIDGVGKKIESEQERLARVSATGLMTPKPANNQGKVVLTREQKEFCDINGISYEEYARTLRKAGERGIEI